MSDVPQEVTLSLSKLPQVLGRVSPLRWSLRQTLCLRFGALMAAGWALVPLLTGCGSAASNARVVYFPSRPANPRVVHLLSFNRLDELVPVRRDWLGVLRGTSVDAQVGTPSGMAYGGGILYVCDTDANVVHAWDLTAGKARRLGESGSNALQKPVDVVVAADGTTFVADTGRSEVVAFRADGSFAAAYRPASAEIYQPVALALRDGKLYVADVARLGVDVLDVANGHWIQSLGLPADDDRRAYPLGLAFDPAGSLVVVDGMGARALVMDNEGNVVRTFGQPGDRYGDLGRPRHLDVGPDGVVFITDAAFAHVHLFDGEGRLLLLIGSDQGGPAATPMPVGVAVADVIPGAVSRLVPNDFDPTYLVFVANTVGDRRINLFAVGMGK